ncbi:hypothetical protein SAMN04488581_4363 [Mycolicibacterium neoaurum]|uniref:Wadjet anti-phage system protein JetD domain-containing protein n=1 Tax=Mycolicibacterium neoaurum TaxID=1795 RepID=UPI0005677793|nr:Wadjet anti-phage system protein JetD domain-containing protein [Mycolicibacterium neoaurum]SDE61697.1 hypothetical protein SAMN04488581_4363 [Mycolicibacterium neoaurum]
MSPEPALIQALWRTIQTHRTRVVRLPDLLRAGASIDHTGAATVGWRARIRAAIDHLESEGRITLPVTKFDTSGLPPLPLYVTRVPGTLPARRARPAPPVWHAEMSWAAELYDRDQLTPADQRFLTTINAWLSRRRGASVPLRERSLQIFGDEKLLETRVSGPLFAPGRLTLALLQTYLCWPPVQRIDLGAGDWLIVENFTTYHSIGRRAAELGFVGQIIWGAGTGVTTRLAALATEHRPPPRIIYFGDVDAGGFRIARSATARAETLSLPPVVAATGLYHLSLRHGEAKPVTNARAVNPALAQWANSWLGAPLNESVAELLTARRRIVQETVGTELLATTTLDDWF